MSVRNETAIATGDRIADVARSTEAVSIGLLAAIDSTVDAMHGVAQVSKGLSKILSGLCEKVEATPVVESNYFDPDDVTIDLLSNTVSVLKGALAILAKKRDAINCDCRLNDHHCESLHDAYEAAMEAVGDLIDVAEATRHAIIRHDLKAERRSPGSFDSGRMRRAVESESILATAGMSREEKRKFIILHANR